MYRKGLKMNSKGNFSPFLIALTLLISITYLPATASFTSEAVFNPTIEAKKTYTKIVIDGEFDVDEWRHSARSSNFVERFPGDKTAPEVKTEIFLTYDDDNLYVAFICHDDPEAIRATFCSR